MAMFDDKLIGAIALATLLFATSFEVRAAENPKFPDLSGQWVRAEGAGGVGRFDPTKPPGRGQQAPLNAEYRAIYEANLADQAARAGRASILPIGACRPACRALCMPIRRWNLS
jgi:hypothetical protein